jgi:hypothetical protein
MWVKGDPMHCIIYRRSKNILISVEVMKLLNLWIKSHPQPYTILCLFQGRYLCVTQPCLLSYGIKPFKDEALRDISHLEVCDVFLGQPYLWKFHVVYESIIRSVIITLGRQLYRIIEVAPHRAIYLIYSMKCLKVISQTGKFILFMIHSKSE